MQHSTPLQEKTPPGGANNLTISGQVAGAATAELYARTRSAGVVTVCHKYPGGRFNFEHVNINEAGQLVDSLAGADTWVSACTVHRVASGRGDAKDIARVLTLPLDIDFKDTGLGNAAAGMELIHLITELVRTPPMATVFSGGGIQPWWLLDADDPLWTSSGPTDPHLAELSSTLKRWGRLCTKVANDNNLGALDSVSDLARVLRAPGSTNYKYDPPRIVRTDVYDDTRPLGYAELVALLDAMEIPAYDHDRVVMGQVVAPAESWEWAPTTCGYVTKMVTGWTTDEPLAGGNSGRHPWLVSNAVRLHAAARNGCLTDADYRGARESLTTRMGELCAASTWGTPRRVEADEITAVHNFARARVETKTPTEVAKELGGHVHAGGQVLALVPSDVTEVWPPLRTIKPAAGNPRPVPIDGLPKVLRDMITGTAAACGAPRDVVLGGALGVAAAATRGVFDAVIHGAWNVNTSVLWTLALSPSGTAKGDAFRPLRKPLQDAEHTVIAAVKKENRGRTVRRGTINSELKMAEKLEDDKEVARCLDALDKVDALPVPQYLKDDVTVEACGQIMENNGGPMALISTEGEQFLTAAGSYQQGAARLGLFNRAKDAESFSDGRVGRESTTVARPTLSWVMAIQPAVLRGYASDSTEGSGFLNRFIFLLPEKMSRREYPLPEIPTEVSHAWNVAITALHTRTWEIHQEATGGDEKIPAGHMLRFTPEAGQLLIDLKNDIEGELQNEIGRYMGLESWIAKHPTDLARVALVFAVLENPDVTGVEVGHVVAALTMFDAFVNHARATFDQLRAVDREDTENQLLTAIIKIGQPIFTTREIHQRVRGQSWVTCVEDVRDVLADLTLGYTDTDSGPIRGPVLPEITGRAGRPSESWHVHPELLTGVK